MADRLQHCKRNAPVGPNNSARWVGAEIDANSADNDSAKLVEVPMRICGGQWLRTCDDDAAVAAAHQHKGSCCRKNRQPCIRMSDCRCVLAVDMNDGRAAGANSHSSRHRLGQASEPTAPATVS